MNPSVCYCDLGSSCLIDDGVAEPPYVAGINPQRSRTGVNIDAKLVPLITVDRIRIRGRGRSGRAPGLLNDGCRVSSSASGRPVGAIDISRRAFAASGSWWRNVERHKWREAVIEKVDGAGTARHGHIAALDAIRLKTIPEKEDVITAYQHIVIS